MLWSPTEAEDSLLFSQFTNSSSYLRKKKKVKSDSSNWSLTIKNPNFLLQNEEESTIRERERVYKNSINRLPAYGLRIKDLSKTFAKMCSKNRV